MKKLFVSLGTAAGVFLAVAQTAKADVRGHWNLDDGTGNEISDSSEHGNIGFAKDIKWQRGAINSSVLFENKGTINCGNDKSLNIDKQISIEAWVRPWALDYKKYPKVLHKDGAYSLRFAPGGALSLALWLDGKEVTLESDKTTWKNGKWQHVAATFDGTTMVLYVNGKKNSEKVVAGNKTISASNAFCFIGSDNGKSPFRGPIDEVRLTAKAFSAEDIKASYDKGRYDMEVCESRFTTFFNKKGKRDPKAVVPGTVWIDAEDFSDYGGWLLDTQFVPNMGSPYLLAAGIGTPVKDASTVFSLEEGGTYQLWIRTKNWLKDHSPGTFKVSINGNVSPQVFGAAGSKNWVWQSGGIYSLKPGQTKLVMSDLTGYYGRCDALILTKDLGYKPPAELQAYKKERDRLTGSDATVTTVGDYDVVVVGAGVAGINAAVSAARTGAKTALVQDRPMIGGNNSAELGVPVLGPADFGKKNARESGLNEEIGREHAFNYRLKWSQGAEIVAAKEKNLTIFLNTRVYDAEMSSKNEISAVNGFDMFTGKRTRYTAKMFIDCTGDGWLGYYAGAEHRLGRESKHEFNESNAPEKADTITMSGSLFTGSNLGYNSRDIKKESPFDGPEWLYDFRANAESLQKRPQYKKSHKSGCWWHENHGRNDDLWDPEWARDDLLMVSMSYWNWIKKHSSLKDKAANRKISIIPIGNAKRETRRLMGDHILNQHEVLKGKMFEDRIGHGGWGLDVHHPEGIFSKEGPFDFNTHGPMHNIPFRTLYSKNISNLLMAGRNTSVTHTALGTTRVQGTTGIMGQAVGTAAAMCVDKKVKPRELGKSHIKDLQQQLLKDDQYIINMKNEDSNDFARSATITASSAMSDAFAPTNIISGVTRIVGENKNMWASDPKQKTPQWIQLDLGSQKSLNSVYLTFDTDLNDKKHVTWEYKQSHRMVPECVKDYEVQYFDGASWQTLVDVKNNYQRRRIHRFPAIKASKLKVVVTATNGDKSARIYEVRAYNE